MWWRLRHLLIKKLGQNLRTVQLNRWTRTWFHDHCTSTLVRTDTRRQRNHVQKSVGELRETACTEKGMGNRTHHASTAPLTSNVPHLRTRSRDHSIIDTIRCS